MNEERLSRIETLWSLVRNANDRHSARARSAQHKLLERYRHAMQRYLLASLGDENAAEEVFQELSLKLVRGDFHSADPAKGRFRIFIKTCLHRLIIDYHRQQKKLNHQLVDSVPENEMQTDEEFVRQWREEVLIQSWMDLEQVEDETDKPWHCVLRARTDHPEFTSVQLAEVVSAKTGKQVSAENLRVLLHRAREKFSDIVVRNVADTIEVYDRDAIENELAQLQLLSYCRTSLERIAKND